MGHQIIGFIVAIPNEQSIGNGSSEQDINDCSVFIADAFIE